MLFRYTQELGTCEGTDKQSHNLFFFPRTTWDLRFRVCMPSLVLF